MRLIDADKLENELMLNCSGVNVYSVVEDQPTIDPENLRPTAQLVQNEFGAIKCKNCGACVTIGGKNTLHNAKRKFRFCYNCGAKLEELKDEAIHGD